MIPTFPTPPGVDRNPGNAILTAPAELAEKLAAPFDPHFVEWRPGTTTHDKKKAKALSYVDARAVRQRFNQVCGIGGWQLAHYAIGSNQIGCAIAIWVNGQWIVKTDGSYAGLLDPRAGQNGKVDAKEQARLDMEGKGAFSASLKRAAAAWGIGEYLYTLEAPWQPVIVEGGYVQGFTEGALHALYDIAARPYYNHHDLIATRHEVGARGYLQKGDLTSAMGGARAALATRKAVFGVDHESTKRVGTLIHAIEQKMATANGSAGPSAEHGDDIDPDLRKVIEQMNHAATGEEVQDIARPLWVRWNDANTADGRAYRAAIQTNMRRFDPSWSFEKSRAARAAQSNAAPPVAAPAPQAKPARASVPPREREGGPPGPARAPAKAKQKKGEKGGKDGAPAKARG